METKELITMALQILVGLSIITGCIVFIVKWCFDISKRVYKIEDKIDGLPIEIESKMIKLLLPFSVSTLNMQNNPLSPDEIVRMNKLMIKLQSSIITIEEAEDLKKLLAVEKEEAENKNNANLLLAIGIALAAISLIIAISGKQK